VNYRIVRKSEGDKQIRARVLEGIRVNCRIVRKSEGDKQIRERFLEGIRSEL
jgi:hypothetical protein